MGRQLALQLFEIRYQLTCGLVTLVGVLGEYATDDVLEFDWRARYEVPDRQRLSVGNRHHRVMDSFPAEGSLAAD